MRILLPASPTSLDSKSAPIHRTDPRSAERDGILLCAELASHGGSCAYYVGRLRNGADTCAAELCGGDSWNFFFSCRRDLARLFFEASCQLTFAALFGLYLAGRWNSLVRILWCERYPLDPELRFTGGSSSQRFTGNFFSPFSSCLGAFITTAPIVICWFSSCAPFSVAINYDRDSTLYGWVSRGRWYRTHFGLDRVSGSEAVLGLSLSSTKFFLTVLKILSNCRDYLPGGYLEFNPADAKLRAAYFSLLIPLFWFTPDFDLTEVY